MESIPLDQMPSEPLFKNYLCTFIPVIPRGMTKSKLSHKWLPLPNRSHINYLFNDKLLNYIHLFSSAKLKWNMALHFNKNNLLKNRIISKEWGMLSLWIFKDGGKSLYRIPLFFFFLFFLYLYYNFLGPCMFTFQKFD